ncbi:1697_t:CDS:1, partial [Rhizophagus irregularis]
KLKNFTVSTTSTSSFTVVAESNSHNYNIFPSFFSRRQQAIEIPYLTH